MRTPIRTLVPSRSVCRYDDRTACVPITSRNEIVGSLRLDQPSNLFHLTFFKYSCITIFWFVYPS
jgi:hypothetical protein